MTLKTVIHGEEKVIPNGVPVDHSTETRGKSSKSSSVILRKTGEAEAAISPPKQFLNMTLKQDLPYLGETLLVQDECFFNVCTPLLQKRFIGAGKNPFVGAIVVPTHAFRC